MRFSKLSIYILVVLGVVFGFGTIYTLLQKNQSPAPTVQSRVQNINLYFINTNTAMLESETRAITATGKKDILAATLDELENGPKTPGLSASIPKQVEILSVHLDSAVAEIDLSAGYKGLKPKEEVFFKASLVRTLTDLAFISYVKLSIEGEELLMNNGQPVGLMGKDDIVSGPIITPEPVNKQIVKLYFGNKEGTGLVAEEREIEVNPNEPLEKYIVEQLIIGPSTGNLFPAIPAETKIKEITTKDGICYVNFNNEFRTKHMGGSTGETLTIYSIVNSLTELSTVKKVQFFIEGEKQETFKGHLDFIKPFERNEQLILN